MPDLPEPGGPDRTHRRPRTLGMALSPRGADVAASQWPDFNAELHLVRIWVIQIEDEVDVGVVRIRQIC